MVVIGVSPGVGLGRTEPRFDWYVHAPYNKFCSGVRDATTTVGHGVIPGRWILSVVLRQRLPSVGRDTVGVLLILVSAAGFGTLGIFGVYAQRAGLSIPTVLLYRFVVATLVVWALLAWTGRLTLLRGRALGVGLGLGVFGYAAQSGLYFLGLEFMTPGMVAIVLYTYPAFVVVLAVLAIGERVGRRTLLALALSLGGVALAIGANPAGASVIGILIVLGAAIAYAAYITLSRRMLDITHPLVLTAHVLPGASVTFLTIGLATGSLTVPSASPAWGILVGLGTVATAVPVFAFFAGLERIGASSSGIVSTVEPPITVALGALLFDDPVTVVTVVGGALILSAVVILHRR